MGSSMRQVEQSASGALADIRAARKIITRKGGDRVDGGSARRLWMQSSIMIKRAKRASLSALRTVESNNQGLRAERYVNQRSARNARRRFARAMANCLRAVGLSPAAAAAPPQLAVYAPPAAVLPPMPRPASTVVDLSNETSDKSSDDIDSVMGVGVDSAALGLGFDSSGRDDKDGAGISDDDERSMPSLTAGSPKRHRLFCKTPPSSTVYGDSPTRALSSSSSESSDVASEISLELFGEP